MGHTVETVRI